MWEGSLLSTPSPAFILCGFVDDGHFDWPHQRLDSCRLLLLSEGSTLHKGGELVDEYVCMSGDFGGLCCLGVSMASRAILFSCLNISQEP